jgi:hypothetical protein
MKRKSHLKKRKFSRQLEPLLFIALIGCAFAFHLIWDVHAPESPRYEYPPEANIANYSHLKTFVDKHGSTLPVKPQLDTFVHYDTADKDSTSINDDDSMRLGYWQDAQQKDSLEEDIFVTPGGVHR